MDNNIYVLSMSCDLYNNNNQYRLVFLINLFQCPILLAVHTGARTPDEPIQTWHTGTMIRTRE